MNGFYPAVAGALAQDRRLEILTANLANANTPGFKASIPVFRTFLSGTSTPGVLPVGDFSRPGIQPLDSDAMGWISSSVVDLRPGDIKQTGSALDLAIDGEGFFAIRTSQGERYTRGGNFTRKATGELVTQDGSPVLGINGGPIRLGPGEMTVSDNGGITVEGNPAGTLKVVTFKNPQLLEKAGEGLLNLREGTPDLVPAQTLRVRQGYLETSNVSVVEQLTGMITTLRAFEAYQKVIQSHDEVTGKSIEIGRI